MFCYLNIKKIAKNIRNTENFINFAIEIYYNSI